MKTIPPKEAIMKLRNDFLAGIIAIDNLTYLIKDEEQVECYSDDTVVIIVNSCPTVTTINVIPLQPDVNVQRVFDFITNTYMGKVNILFDVQKLLEPEEVKRLFVNRYCYIEKNIIDYGAVELKSCKMLSCAPAIRFLTSEDRDVFIAMESEVQKYRPTLPQLFDLFIIKKIGYILAYFEGDKICGYLSYTQLFDTVYDVDHIYVSPSARNKGIGRELGKAYSKQICSLGGIPYWSSAKNEGSERIAQLAGLDVVRKTYRFTNE